MARDHMVRRGGTARKNTTKGQGKERVMIKPMERKHMARTMARILIRIREQGLLLGNSPGVITLLVTTAKSL